MALLHSLQISGIRSFSPETHERIFFNTPVTLFLGQNGSGKTTIIECIRYALTGELPGGTSSGQGFLNDPKMSGKASTKASIKIKFFDAQGNLITLSRFMSVTAKAEGKLTFKSLMFNIRKRDKNSLHDPQDISGRCVDINTYCSTALNVSKSILNNVLFCHQENSLWPLDESKKLKEKFDEIFDATKYNKCVDALRKYLKDKHNNVKVLKERLNHRKTVKENVEQLRGKLSRKNDELKQITKQIDEKRREIEPLKNRRTEILELEENLGTLQRELSGKKAEKKGLQEQQATIKKHISYIFDGSDENLNKKINTFENEKTVEEKCVRDLESKKKELTTKITELNNSMQKLQVKIGQMKEEQKQFKSKTEENEKLIENLRCKLELKEFQDVSNEEIINQFVVALEKNEADYNNLVKQKDAEEKEFQNKIDQIREQYAATKEQITSKKKSVIESQTKIKDIKMKLDDLDTSDSQLKIVGDRIEKLKSELNKYKNSFNEAEKQKEIEELKEVVERKERDLDKLDREYRILQQNFVTEQKLESERNVVLEKQGEINRIKSKQSHNIQKLFSGNVPEKNFKKNILEIQNQQDRQLKALTNKITELERDTTKLEATLIHEKKKLSIDRKDLALREKKVAELCKDRPFNDVLKESHAKREKLQKDKGQYSSAKIMYKAFIDKFEKEKPCCPICETDFSNKGTVVKKIITQLKSKVESVPTKLAQVENELKKEEDYFNKLQQLKTVNDEIEVLKNAKIPLTEDEINRLSEQYEVKKAELTAEKLKLTTPQELIEACKHFIADATLLDQYSMDIIRAKESIQDLEQATITVSSNRSRQETEAEIDDVKAELSNRKNRYESCKKNLDLHKDRCQKLNTNIQSETQKQIDIQKLVQQKPLLEAQFAEYNEKLVSLGDEIEELTDVLAAQEAEKESAEEEKQKAVVSNRKIKEDERNKIASNKNILRDILKLRTVLEKYKENKTEAKLDEAIQELAELKVYEGKLDEAKDAVTNAITQKIELLAKQDSEFRALKDNVILREKIKMENELDKEITELEKNIGNYNYRSVYDEKQRIERNLEKANREISSLTGQQEEIGKQVKDMEKELERPENKNAFNNFKKQFYGLKVEQLAIEDCSNYVNVLEKSILKFHEERMVQINRTIKELWRDIYRGNDIDYIEIKTDEHMTGGVNRRRTYNYKVVQVKNNVELEMRGRCSAGQKVLACLVIRIALAETFSSTCGILALDEPTTNLDRENISSLSGALARIIDAREREKNFQLLVITHDEEFLSALSTVNSLESYWKVMRTQEGFSTVKKHDL